MSTYTPRSEAAERQRFEVFIRESGYEDAHLLRAEGRSLDRIDDNREGYYDPRIALAWDAWRAREALTDEYAKNHVVIQA